VLVIDDEWSWLEFARTILIGLGADVLPHIGSRGALMAARVYAPDVILLDLCVPDLYEDQTLSELKKTGAKIYFCSDSEPGKLQSIAKIMGVSGVITKTELRDPDHRAIRKILEKEQS
jgi:CheY-like chemotaxis protein